MGLMKQIRIEIDNSEALKHFEMQIKVLEQKQTDYAYLKKRADDLLNFITNVDNRCLNIEKSLLKLNSFERRLKKLEKKVTYKNQEDKERFISALRKAGLK